MSGRSNSEARLEIENIGLSLQGTQESEVNQKEQLHRLHQLLARQILNRLEQPCPPLPAQRLSDTDCAVCMSVMVEPCTLFCGHSFCSSCFRSHVSAVGRCPQCLDKVHADWKPAVNLKLSELVLKTRAADVLIRKEVEQIREKGNELFREGRYGDAVEQYGEAVTKMRTAANLCARSAAYLRMKKMQEALEDADAAIAVDPMYSKGYFHRALALFELQRVGDAFSALVQCVRLRPNDASAWEHVANYAAALLKSDPHSDLLALLPPTEPGRAPSDSDSDLGRPVPAEVAERYRGLDISADDFECSLCFNLLYEPVATKCGHVFCKECLERALDHQHACPFCREPIGEFVAYNRRPVCVSLHRILSTKFHDAALKRKEAIEAAADEALKEVAVFVCSLALPGIPCHLHIFEPRYRLMIRRAMESGHRRFGMCTYDPYSESGYSDYGTMLHILHVHNLPDGRSNVRAVGERRFRVLERGVKDGYNVARVEWYDDMADQVASPCEPRREQGQQAGDARGAQRDGKREDGETQGRQSGKEEPGGEELRHRGGPQTPSETAVASKTAQAAGGGGGTESSRQGEGEVALEMRGRETQELHEELMRFAMGWLARLSPVQVRKLELEFGAVPQDAALLTWWCLMILPLMDEAKVPFLAIRSVRERLLRLLQLVRSLPRPGDSRIERCSVA